MKVVILGEHQGNGIRYEMYLSAPAGGAAQMLRNPEGNWVGYAEYAALKAEVERLKTERDHYQWASTNDGIACNERARENQHLENQIDALKAENERLKEAWVDKKMQEDRDFLLQQNERLRKAGDAMAEYIKGYSIADKQDYPRQVFNWIAAKEVQP
jgi:uncharacterized small protein (DUF1192 family)